MFKSAMLCHANDFDSTKLVIFWINLNMGVLSIGLQWNRSMNQNSTLVTSAIQGQHTLNMFFCWSLCANDSQLIWKFAWHSNTTYPKHLPLEFLGGHVEGVRLWHCCLQLQSFPKNSQNNGFKNCELIWVGMLPPFWVKATFCLLETIPVKVR